MSAGITSRREVDTTMERSAYPIHLRFLRRRGLSAEYAQWLRRVHGEHGSTLVETALSLVVLLTVALGVMEMSLALYTYHFISDAAREGTRYAIVRGSSCPASLSGCPAAGAGVDVQTYVRGLGFPGITPGLMTATTTFPSGTGCTPQATPCNNPGNLVRVVVVYQFPLSIPFLAARTLRMSSTSQMVISQ
jgi:Flp pilus assembly protein TadG